LASSASSIGWPSTLKLAISPDLRLRPRQMRSGRALALPATQVVPSQVQATPPATKRDSAAGVASVALY